jgi:hypothetical protein
MGKTIKFVKASQLGGLDSDRRKYVEFCISGITGGCVQMPDMLRQPMMDAVRAYGDGIAVVVRDEERLILLHGDKEMEEIRNTGISKEVIFINIPQNVWNDDRNDAPEFLEAAREVIYLGLYCNPRYVN